MKEFSELSGLCLSPQPLIYTHTCTHSSPSLHLFIPGSYYGKHRCVLERAGLRVFFFLVVVYAYFGRLENLHCRLVLSFRVCCLELLGEFLFWTQSIFFKRQLCLVKTHRHFPMLAFRVCLVHKKKPVETCRYWCLDFVGGSGERGVVLFSGGKKRL